MERLSSEVRTELSRFGPQAGLGEVLTLWPSAVGDAIARNAWPARIARDGTVHINTSDSVWAFELGHQALEIAARLGVEKLRFAPGPLPEHAVEVAIAEPLRPSPAQEEQAAAIAASIEDETLRRSVQKAVSFSLASDL